VGHVDEAGVDAMLVKSIRWVGVATDRYAEMTGFLEGVMGLGVRFRAGTTTELCTADGDAIQVVAPGDPYHELFSRHATGPVPLFEVDDVRAARAELEASGIEVGDLARDSEWEWLHFRAPDGNLYELASRLPR
jgi:catechol 2,3-dioxygenase-like lactoylglutathione lyase family enzyme